MSGPARQRDMAQAGGVHAESNGLPVARTLVRGRLAELFGPSPVDPAGDPDPGLFGPGSATWRVIAEPASIVGGIRGLLVQLLHPLAVAGVVQHSDFERDPLARLHATARYVTATAFGSTEEALSAARVVRRVHRHVAGTAADGRAYSTADPHLLAWVSIALTSSFLAAHQSFAPTRLTRVEQDAFVAEQSTAAALLDPRVNVDVVTRHGGSSLGIEWARRTLPMLREGALPTTAHELDAAIGRYGGELAVGDEGQRLLRFLAWPPIAPTVRAAYLQLFTAAVAILGSDQRELLGVRLPAPAIAVMRLHGRATVGMLRLASGTSPSERTARRRLAGVQDAAA